MSPYAYLPILHLLQFDAMGSKVLLASFGAACVGLSISVSFGICAYLDAIIGGAEAGSKLFYGPVHSCLPFLLLGVGTLRENPDVY